MADRLPPDHPPLPLHDPLQEDETLSEQCHQPRAARGQRPTALGGAAEAIGLAGSGRICSLRTDHLRRIHADADNLFHGRSPLSEINNNDLILTHSVPPEAVHTNNSTVGEFAAAPTTGDKNGLCNPKSLLSV